MSLTQFVVDGFLCLRLVAFLSWLVKEAEEWWFCQIPTASVLLTEHQFSKCQCFREHLGCFRNAESCTNRCICETLVCADYMSGRCVILKNSISSVVDATSFGFVLSLIAVFRFHFSMSASSRLLSSKLPSLRLPFVTHFLRLPSSGTGAKRKCREMNRKKERRGKKRTGQDKEGYDRKVAKEAMGK